MAQIIDGKKISQEIKDELKEKVAAYKEKGYEITLPENAIGEIYVAGAVLDGDTLKTSGGRVLGATCVGESLKMAIDKAYRLADTIKFDNKYMRNDIGLKALKAKGE